MPSSRSLALAKIGKKGVMHVVDKLRKRSDASMLGEADFIGKFMRLLSGSNESLFFSHSSFTDALLSFVSLFDSSIVMLHFESKSEFK